MSSSAELARLELLGEDGDSVPRSVGSVWDTFHAIHLCYSNTTSSGGADLTYRQGVAGFHHQVGDLHSFRGVRLETLAKVVPRKNGIWNESPRET